MQNTGSLPCRRNHKPVTSDNNNILKPVNQANQHTVNSDNDNKKLDNTHNDKTKMVNNNDSQTKLDNKPNNNSVDNKVGVVNTLDRHLDNKIDNRPTRPSEANRRKSLTTNLTTVSQILESEIARQNAKGNRRFKNMSI